MRPVSNFLIMQLSNSRDGTGSLQRIRKDSFYWYRDVIASNGTKLS